MTAAVPEPPHLVTDLKTLCLATMTAEWRPLAAQATRERQPPAEYLAQLVHLEVTGRRGRHRPHRAPCHRADDQRGQLPPQGRPTEPDGPRSTEENALMGTRRDVASRRSAPSGHVATTTLQRGPFSRCQKVPFLLAISNGRAFANDEDLNEQASRWLEGTANVRRHGTTGERPVDRFERDERAVLRPLARRPYQRLGVHRGAEPAHRRVPDTIAVERRSLRVYAEAAG